ncbi:hypothetical protein [Prosthecomicrobium hirschii]|uniref:hypothetical protein n=1 Tax=Prosthecodimorpha hirschii TaxID=665126 RepID=UPI0022205459|nr:hypothetical protein [Prosthecomicrobium hirschii]MCW1840447.1 hypothetical protein [Prosthecomicrobium hirschii]
MSNRDGPPDPENETADEGVGSLAGGNEDSNACAINIYSKPGDTARSGNGAPPLTPRIPLLLDRLVEWDHRWREPGHRAAWAWAHGRGLGLAGKIRRAWRAAGWLELAIREHGNETEPYRRQLIRHAVADLARLVVIASVVGCFELGGAPRRGTLGRLACDLADIALQIEREIRTLDDMALFGALPADIITVDRTAEADHRDAIGDHLTDWRRLAGDLLVTVGGADAR